MAKLGYMRTSTSDGRQTTDSQRHALAAAGVEKFFEDACSGATPIEKRKGWQSMMDFAREGDTVTVFRMDRVSRSLVQFVGVIQVLEERSLHLESVSESFDTSTPGGMLQRNILIAFADYEREVIRSRVREGLSAARERNGGVNPGGRPRAVADADIPDLLARLDAGRARKESMRAIAERLGVSRATLYRLDAARKASPEA